MNLFETRLISFLLVTFVADIEALRCWKCENAVSDTDCKERGRLVQCQTNQNSCFSEYRFNGVNKLITRRCKQSHACNNNQNQNNQPAWMPTRCNDVQGSVCRCCCSTDNCNRNEALSCGAKFAENEMTSTPVCPQQTNLRRVEAKCSERNLVGSVCRFSCSQSNFIFEPGSVRENICLSNGSWSSLPPCCRSSCPPKSIMDLVIVLDASGSDRRHWRKILLFVSKFISRMTLSKKMVKVFVLSYTHKVGWRQPIFQNRESRSQIWSQLKKMRFSGPATHIYKILRYVREITLMNPANRRNVTDAVLIFTDGYSTHKLSQVLRDFKNDGTEVYQFDITNQQTKELHKLTEGGSNRIWHLPNNFVAQSLADKIGQIVCENSCS